MSDWRTPPVHTDLNQHYSLKDSTEPAGQSRPARTRNLTGPNKTGLKTPAVNFSLGLSSGPTLGCYKGTVSHVVLYFTLITYIRGVNALK